MGRRFCNVVSRMASPFARSVTTLLLLPAGLALGACSEDVGLVSGGRLDRPRLKRVTPLATPPVTRMLARLTVPAGTDPWSVEAAEGSTFRRVTREGGDSVLRFRGQGPWRLVVPGPFESNHFDRVVLTGDFCKKLRMRLRFTTSRAQPYRFPKQLVFPRGRRKAVTFDLLEVGAGGTRFRRATPVFYDTLELEFEGGIGSFNLESITLLEQPIELCLPDPEGAGGLIHVGVESRHGWGLPSGDPLTCEFPVETERDVLSFACALDRRLRADGLRPRVRVALESAEVRQETIVELENVPEEELTWHDARIELSAFVGRTLRATFRYELDDNASGVCALANVAVSRADRAAPFVLLITSDTHRGDHLGSAGRGVTLDTPVIDALAARGILFEDCWSTTNITVPSHASIMTGIHPRDHRVINNKHRVSDDARTLAEIFRAEGFHTVAVVSVRTLGPGRAGLGQGFECMLGPERGVWTTERSAAILRERLEASDSAPTFAWLHVHDAHAPYEPPAPFADKYYPREQDPFDPSLPELELGDRTMPFKMRYDERGTPPQLFELRDVEFPRGLYRAAVSYLDHHLEPVIELCERRGGFVVFTSDHGELLGYQGSYFNHDEIFPDTLHVPLVVAGPSLPQGVRVREPVELIDVGRTLLDLAGLVGVDFRGRNLLATLDGGYEAETRFALSANGTSASITAGSWHLILHLRRHKGFLPTTRERDEVDLYDRSSDPACLEDLEHARLDKVAELRARLVRWLREQDGEVLVEDGMLTTDGLEELAALGYATGIDAPKEEPWYVPPAERGEDGQEE